MWFPSTAFGASVPRPAAESWGQLRELALFKAEAETGGERLENCIEAMKYQSRSGILLQRGLFRVGYYKNPFHIPINSCAKYLHS